MRLLTKDSKINVTAIISICLSLIGLIADIILRRPMIDSLGIGFILSFAGFLISLASVRDTGRNIPSHIAFWLGFGCMWVTLALTLL